MKTFNMSEFNTDSRAKILEEARTKGAVLQRKNTNGKVLEEFILVVSINDEDDFDGVDYE